MTANFNFNLISAEEYDRLRDVHDPMTQSIRRLIDAGIRTGADEDTIREATAAIDAVSERLERQLHDAPSNLLHEGSRTTVQWANPVVGLRNAIAPPVLVQQDDEGRRWAEFTLGHAYEGPPGWVHGGVLALVLDQMLGEAASEGMTRANFTGTISLRYLRGTALGPVRTEAFIERVEGVKTYARGHLSDVDGRTVEAEGVFIQPAWARDAG